MLLGQNENNNDLLYSSELAPKTLRRTENLYRTRKSPVILICEAEHYLKLFLVYNKPTVRWSFDKETTSNVLSLLEINLSFTREKTLSLLLYTALTYGNELFIDFSSLFFAWNNVAI